MCMDLNTVMKRYIVDEQNKQKDRVSPIKITRSVGLQVVTDRNRRSQGNQQVAKSSPSLRTAVPIAPKAANAKLASGSLTSMKKIGVTITQKPITTVEVNAAGSAAVNLKSLAALASVSSSNTSRLTSLPSSVSIIHTTPLTTSSTATLTKASTIMPAAAPAALATLTPAGAAKAKQVIDIVDLSDDEDTSSSKKPAPQPPKPPQLQNGLRLIPTSQLKTSGSP